MYELNIGPTCSKKHIIWAKTQLKWGIMNKHIFFAILDFKIKQNIVFYIALQAHS